jgi:hypothetical protein
MCLDRRPNKHFRGVLNSFFPNFVQAKTWEKPSEYRETFSLPRQMTKAIASLPNTQPNPSNLNHYSPRLQLPLSLPLSPKTYYYPPPRSIPPSKAQNNPNPAFSLAISVSCFTSKIRQFYPTIF